MINVCLEDATNTYIGEIMETYQPENSSNEIYSNETFCLIEQDPSSNLRFWVSFHDSFDDIVTYCADPENADTWLPHKVVNLHDGSSYRPIRSLSFVQTR